MILGGICNEVPWHFLKISIKAFYVSVSPKTLVLQGQRPNCIHLWCPCGLPNTVFAILSAANKH